VVIARRIGSLGEGVSRDALLLAAGMFLVVSTTNILTPLLPQVRDEFAISIAMAGVVVGAYGLSRVIIDLPAGFLTDRFGHRTLTIVALALFVGSSAVGLASPTVLVLLVARIAAGISVGIMGTVVLAGLSATADAATRGKVMSLFHVANNVGIAFYPLLGGVIGVTIGWRATFAVTGVLGIAAGALLLPVLSRVDFRQGEGRARRTIAPDRVLHGSRRTVALGATYFGVTANMIHRHGFRNTILPLYAATALGLGGVSIATAISLMAITGLFVATPGGMLGDRIGRRRVITAGLAALAAGDLVFLLTHDYLTFLLVAGLIGFGDFFASSQTALLSEIVPPEQRTRVLSGYRFASDFGSLVGPILLAAVMDASSARVAILVAVAFLAAGSLAARFGLPSFEGLALSGATADGSPVALGIVETSGTKGR
jgi:MFS family permease